MAAVGQQHLPKIRGADDRRQPQATVVGPMAGQHGNRRHPGIEGKQQFNRRDATGAGPLPRERHRERVGRRRRTPKQRSRRRQGQPVRRRRRSCRFRGAGKSVPGFHWPPIFTRRPSGWPERSRLVSARRPPSVSQLSTWTSGRPGRDSMRGAASPPGSLLYQRRRKRQRGFLAMCTCVSLRPPKKRFHDVAQPPSTVKIASTHSGTNSHRPQSPGVSWASLGTSLVNPVALLLQYTRWSVWICRPAARRGRP